MGWLSNVKLEIISWLNWVFEVPTGWQELQRWPQVGVGGRGKGFFLDRIVYEAVYDIQLLNGQYKYPDPFLLIAAYSNLETHLEKGVSEKTPLLIRSELN